MEIEFTGEFFVPGKSGERIEADHMERYKFACAYAKGQSVLDIACGAGYAAPLLMEAGAKNYNGVDLNPDLARHAAATYGSPEIHYTQGNICTFASSVQFDLITCFETIEHVPEFRPAISNLYTLVRSGGMLLISSPNRPISSPKARSLSDKPSNKFHTQEFTPAELLAELRSAGFVVDEKDVFGQRQRPTYTTTLQRKIARLFRGNPDKRTSPAVEPLRSGMSPRYFVVLARKA